MADACCAARPEPTRTDGVQRSRIALVRDEWRSIAAVTAAAMWVIGVVLELADQSEPAKVAFVVTVVAGGATFVPSSLDGLRHGRLGVGLLMTIAMAGALLLGELGEAAALCFLFSVSEALEHWALSRARRGLRAVLALVPEETTVRRLDALVDIPTDELSIGDTIVLRAGRGCPPTGSCRSDRPRSMCQP